MCNKRRRHKSLDLKQCEALIYQMSQVLHIERSVFSNHILRNKEGQPVPHRPDFSFDIRNQYSRQSVWVQMGLHIDSSYIQIRKSRLSPPGHW